MKINIDLTENNIFSRNTSRFIPRNVSRKIFFNANKDEYRDVEKELFLTGTKEVRSIKKLFSKKDTCYC